jgi:hypothetical protein
MKPSYKDGSIPVCDEQYPPPKTRGTTSQMICRKSVRRFLLDYAKRSRAHEFSRVADSVYDQLEAEVRERCRRIVHGQPSAGKTLR